MGFSQVKRKERAIVVIIVEDDIEVDGGVVVGWRAGFVRGKRF